ncbi:MAG: S41 family peptidase [Myxococcota bacterium]|nr:S41 family peptidase [Myxococcota bacterium]
MRFRILPVLLAVFFLGLVTGTSLSAVAGSVTYARLQVFADALAIVESRYVDERDPDTLVYDAIGGLTQGLDDHSVFLDPDQYRDLREVTTGEYSGVGIDVFTRDGRIVVRQVFAGSPAQAAGLEEGDEIVGVNDRTLETTDPSLLLEDIRGLRGTVVVLRIERAGLEAAFDVSVRRAQIRTPSVEAELVMPQIALLRIDRFQRDTAEEVQVALTRLRLDATGDLDGVILDLRGNPGGYLSEAVEIADLWLGDGTIVSTVGRMGLADRDRATLPGTDPDTPLVVLVDGSSASASEVLAGAIQDRKRGRIVGSTTYGKGSVQQFFDLPDGSALKLTTARYFTPNGQDIHGSGVAPDLALDSGDDEARSRTVKDFLAQRSGVPESVTLDPALNLALAWFEDPQGTDDWFVGAPLAPQQ